MTDTKKKDIKDILIKKSTHDSTSIEPIKVNTSIEPSRQLLNNTDNEIKNNISINNQNLTQQSFNSNKVPLQRKQSKALNNSNNLASSQNYQANISKQGAVKAQKKTVCCYAGRDEKVDGDKFYKVIEENEKLKLEQIKNNESFKHIQTQLYKLEEKVIKERNLGERKIIYMDDGSDIQLMNLKAENEKLKEQLIKTKTVISGLAKEKKRATSGTKIIVPKNDISNGLHNEYLKQIKELRNLLNDKDSEIKRLHYELVNNGKKGGGENFSKDIREKTMEFNEMQNKAEQLKRDVETNSALVKHLQNQIEDQRATIRELHSNNLELKQQNTQLEVQSHSIPSLIEQTKQYRERIIEMEENIRSLSESPFIKQAEERGNISRKLKLTEEKLKETNFELEKMRVTNQEQIREFDRLRKENEIYKKERDQFKEEAIRFKVTTEERERNTKNFEEQLRLLGQYGEVDSNFTKILSLLKLKENDNSWMKVEFFDRLGDNNLNNPEFLLKEIEKLVQEKGELGNQLEVTKNVLIIQQKISEDLQKEKNELEKITSFQINELKKKCEQFAQRNDITKYGKSKMTTKNDFRDPSRDYYGRDYDQREEVDIPDDITEFTRDDETQLGMNENVLDLYIGEAVLEDGISNELGIKMNDLLTFASVDFYMHEIQTSNLASGKRPWYNLQIKYHVTEDEHLIKYIDSGNAIVVEIHYLKDNVNFLLGYGNIDLKQLLEAENNTNRVINNVCPIYYKKDASMMIGNIHFKMRFRQSISNTLQWLQEKMRLTNQVSATSKVIQNASDDRIHNLKTITDLNKGRVMQVTILVNILKNLKIAGPPHEIRPYLWYQFHRCEEHFSKTYKGALTDKHGDSIINTEDIQIYNTVYDREFEDYIQNGELSIMVLDDFRALEVKMNQDKENIDLVDNPEIEDFVGIAKINLKSLILQERIQGNFPIINRDGKQSGEVGILIFWEEVTVHNNKIKVQPYETKAWEEEQVIRLGEKLKSKKHNIESAFELFNLDQNDQISLSNFKLVLMTQLKYSDSNEIELLVNLIFRESIFLSKLNFNKIFIPLLPEANANQSNSFTKGLMKEVEKKTTTEITVTHTTDKSKVLADLKEETTTVEIKKDEKTPTKELEKERKSTMLDEYEINYKSQNTKKEIEHNTTSNDLLIDTDRNNFEIVQLIADYMKKTNRHAFSELFKMFDKDSNGHISKKEVKEGFFRIKIPISNLELDRIWADMVSAPTNTNVKMSEFKKFMEKNGFNK